MKRIMFLCRGSVQNGLGHVIRSRRIAKALHPEFSIKFVVIGDEAPENLLANEDFSHAITSSEANALKHFDSFQPDLTIFDLTHVCDETFSPIKSACRTISLSPIFSHLNAVDVVFHRSKERGVDWPTSGERPVIFAGLDYSVISDHCRRITTPEFDRNINDEVLSVAISMGGTDAPNKTLAILKRIREINEKVLFWAILGEGYSHSYEELVHAIRGSKHEIILAKTNESMWRILNTCSLVLLAGGTTTYEAAYAGIPSINMIETAEQFFLIKELVSEGVCTFAGYSFEESLRNIKGLISRFSRNRHELRTMHERAIGLIDGRGVERITSEIRKLISNSPGYQA